MKSPAVHVLPCIAGRAALDRHRDFSFVLSVPKKKFHWASLPSHLPPVPAYVAALD